MRTTTCFEAILKFFTANQLCNCVCGNSVSTIIIVYKKVFCFAVQAEVLSIPKCLMEMKNAAFFNSG